ncbi:MAG: hypothetical protein WCZ11_00820 [Bacilli bacterium]
MNGKKLAIIFGLILSASSIIGIVFNLDNRWAKADDLKKIEMRLERELPGDREAITRNS